MWCNSSRVSEAVGCSLMASILVLGPLALCVEARTDRDEPTTTQEPSHLNAGRDDQVDTPKHGGLGGAHARRNRHLS